MFNFGLYAEHKDVFNVFTAMCTQWNYGPSGPTGLSYVSLTAVWSLLGIKKKNRKQIFLDLQVMEDAALGKIRENQK
jgi:Phage related hypothetical protein (DUF1799)